MATKRILTGIRPTGPLHLGHYVGALEQWVQLQDEYECFFLIADVQALTTHIDRPEVIEESVKEVVLDWIAVGLDPTKPNVHFVLQSSVPELTELTTYFTMLAPFSEMEGNPTIKEEKENLKSPPTAGFMIYPVSQAADILLFTPYPPEKEDKLLVPVGKDQIPHLEGTNRIARRFNRQYGGVFVECTPKVGQVGRLVGTDGQAKMSKSLGNAISLKDDADLVRRQVMKMFTDKTKLRKGDPGHPDECPVYLYRQAFGDVALLVERAAKCRSGELGCVQCKKDLAEALNAFLEPIRTRRREAENMPLDRYLKEGTEKAREVGQITMKAVRSAMHLDYPMIFGV
ncbi:MAG: tryptophan--tRNA ligase [Candidatus Portnoybacteria bacterium CG06_land_8_20_14_3_00_39_12]|uniref:Tryptophan--tRNA ligase n=1 Tax=Candidatus Portnoybacteria bacterium CG06_land_8_20_14_3_00_39_12 TaxID=1974809 RepID=A0A2M7AYB4_9BACT|nr:MAG: tryptophan--tRNA ligase [Candidatus Portnoybacteria bacterium CG06_land_8_20_14_3_00_39_12]